MRIDGAEIQGIVRHFEEIDDPRSEVNRRRLLVDVIVISILGVLAGAEAVGYCHVGQDARAVAERASCIAQWHSLPSYHRASFAIVETSRVSAMFCGMVGLAS